MCIHKKKYLLVKKNIKNVIDRYLPLFERFYEYSSGKYQYLSNPVQMVKSGTHTEMKKNTIISKQFNEKNH